MTRLLAQADASRLPLADASVDLVFTSPPYCEARLYLEEGKKIGADRDCAEWVEWMLTVVAECVRVCRGLVLVNCAGVTRDWNYQPGPEGLLFKWWERGGIAWRPCFWHRVGIPGSGGKQWYRADMEHVLAFVGKRGAIPWADYKANGHAPKWAPGGEMSHRLTDGCRVNQWGQNGGPRGFGNRGKDGSAERAVRPSHTTGTVGREHSKRLADGEMETQVYIPPTKANPGNYLAIRVGGGALGHPYAHDNEAAFPVELPTFFIRSHCKPGGIVLDPFSGSGTTVDAAQQLGRRGIGFDIRFSQAKLARRRLNTPNAKRIKVKTEEPGPPFQQELFL